MLCHPPGTPPSALAPNFALSSAESRNVNRDALWSLLCLKRFIKRERERERQREGCELLRTHQHGLGGWVKVDNSQVGANSSFRPVKAFGSRNVACPQGPSLKLHLPAACLLPYQCPSRYLLVRSRLNTNKTPQLLQPALSWLRQPFLVVSAI